MSATPPPAVTSGAPPAATGAGPSEDEKNMAMLCHAGGILTGFIIPLVMWKLKGKESAFVEEHAKEAMNFELTLLPADFLAFIMIVAVSGALGMLLWAPVLIARLGLGIMGTLAALKGQSFKYVINARLIK
jgi:uncharacterized Tic20 family protein